MAKKYETKTVVLKKAMTDDDVYVMIEEKKSDSFGSVLRRPKREDVHVESVALQYERITSVSGRYESDYFRRATHTVSVPNNVSEVVFGGDVFPVRSRSDLRRKISGKLGKNKVDLPLEEHVSAEYEGRLYFDCGGRETKLRLKTGPKDVERYPHKVLEKNGSAVPPPALSHDEFISHFAEKIRPKLEDEIRDLEEEVTISEIAEIYVPVFEVKLSGPRKRAAIMRIDAVRCRVL